MTSPETSPQRTAAGAPRARRRDRAPGIPDATVARLPVYLRALGALAEDGVVDGLLRGARRRGRASTRAKLRKDLSHLGSYGTRGVGYDVDYLVYQVSRELGLTQDWPVVIVGLGHLGHALANYGGFASRGFAIRALVDADPAIVGHRDRRPARAPAGRARGAGRATSASRSASSRPRPPVAQEVCDRLVARRGQQHPQLRAERAVGARPRRGAQGRHVHRAADPGLPRAAQGRVTPRSPRW